MTCAVWVKVQFVVTTWMLLHQEATGICSYEPANCESCDDYSAKCETAASSLFIPQNLSTDLTSLKVYYKGNGPVNITSSLFARYSKLSRVRLSGLGIKFLQEKTFASLPLLQNVSVTKTSITTVPSQLFSVNASIKVLNLYGNQLRVMPYHLFEGLSTLQLLDLGFNNIILNNCSSIGSAFQKLPNLATVRLMNLTVNESCKTQIVPEFFQPIQRSVKFLNLTKSNIYAGSPKIFQNFSLLEKLDVSFADRFSECPLSARSLFNHMPSSLEELTFRRWRTYEDMDPKCIENSTGLAGLKNLPRLRSLDMKFNDRIFGNVLNKSIFSGFKALEKLDLSWSRFTSVEDFAFDDCPNLKYLNLGGNPLGSRPIRLFSFKNKSSLINLKLKRAGVFSDYAKNYRPQFLLRDSPLKIIDLSRNYLVRMPLFTENKEVFPSLQTIKLNWNFIQDFHWRATDSKLGDQCRYLPGLRNLSISYNSIKNVSSLAECTSITSLDLSHNLLHLQWSEVNEKEISQLTKLQVLDLSFNGLKYISKILVKDMPSLRTLHLVRNNLSTIESFVFDINQLLEILDLRGNFLKEFPVRYIKNLTGLKELLLEDNNIAKIDEELTKYIKRSSIRTFGIIGNPLICPCEQFFFQAWIKSTIKVPFANQLECHDLNKSKIYNYSRDVFDCDYKETVIILASVVGGMVVALLIGLPCYKYRWYISHAGVVFRAILAQISQVHIENTCDYDAYVMYNSASIGDQSWVVTNLRLALEEDNLQLKLYISDRDAIPGSEVYTEMIRAMEASRKIILVLSNSYLKSSQCKGFSDLAGRESYGRALYQPNRIMVLVTEKLDEEAIKAPFTSLLTENVIDIYGRSDKELQRSWSQIRKFLRKPRYAFRKKQQSYYSDGIEMQGELQTD